MRIFRTLLIICLLFQATILFSQEDVLRPKRTTTTTNEEIPDYQIRFGIEGGFNYNMVNQTMNWSSEIPQSIYNVFQSASGLSPYFAALIDFPIDSKFGIQTKFAYDLRSASNTYTGIADYHTPDGDVVDGDEKQELTATGADISISAMLRYNISQEFVFTIGPMISIPTDNYDQKLVQTSLTPGNYFYDEYGNRSTQRTLTYKTSEINTRFGFDLGFAYNIPISESMILSPQIRLNYYLDKIIDDRYGIYDDTRESIFGVAEIEQKDEKLHAIKFGLTLWF